MRLKRSLLVLLITMAFASGALAVPSGKTVEFPGGSEGKVFFDGKTHAEKGLKCADCHPKLFAMKKGAELKMADMNAGKYCGACHNGQKAFSTASDCARCHKK